MIRAAALLWLILVVAAALHVGAATLRGLPLQTDLMALLPREDRDPVVQRAKDVANAALSRRVLLLVGHAEPGRARAAAAELERALAGPGLLLPSGDVPPADALKRLGAAYFPHRAGLLAEDDRRRLQEGRGEELVTRALSQVFGFAGFADGRLLARDPLLLFPAFLAALPVPASRLILEDGRPTITENGVTWVLLSGLLPGEATQLALQRRFVTVLAAAEAGLDPGVRLLRLGTLFYAQAGAERAMAETSRIGLISLAGTALLLVAAFRALRPLLLGLLSVTVGLVTALSVCLLLFGELHVAAQLFGASLIGIAADYALLYFAQMFSPEADPRRRLRQVLPGIVLGVATTVVGYLSLMFSPFPGLHQVAVFSAVGLVGSFLTVVLWLPALDRARPADLGRRSKALAAGMWALWSGRRRWVLFGVGLAVAAVGHGRLTVDDDVRRQQPLDPGLAAQQAEIMRLTGFGHSGQFLVVEGVDSEQTLRREEELGGRLAAVVADGGLAGWQAVARFVPSLARQAENRALVAERLTGPYLGGYRARLGLAGAVAAEPEPGPLTPRPVIASGALPLLATLAPEPGLHLVLLEGVRDPAAVRAAVAGLEGVRFVDSTADVSDLLGAYRRRAVWLLAVSALLMAPLLAWRYGWRRLPAVLGPPVAAVALTPAVLALVGLPFSFFSAMALVLVLSIGVDYAVFCAEDRRRDAVTLTGITLAMLTTLLSFGLLAMGDVAGVRAFGATMLVGVPLALLLAPMAGKPFSR